MNDSRTIEAKFYFKYPSLSVLRSKTPRERLVFLNTKFHKDLERIKKKFGIEKFELIGTKRRLRGFTVKTDRQTFDAISRLTFVSHSFIEEYVKKVSENKRKKSYFCFKMIIQIQIEGRKKGMQSYDERFVVVSAYTFKQAEKKVIKDAKSGETPYLNPYGVYVRWKFESIEDSYQIDMVDAKNFTKPVEVFSTMKSRRLKKENIWDGQ